MRTTAFLVLLVSACGSDPEFVGEVPTNPDALLPWLEAQNYVDWDREAQIHPTAGPHGENVRTYFNVSLAGSMESTNEVHVVESAAVKELYTDGLVKGWAVMVKTDEGEGTDTWYWYEVLDRTRPDNPFSGQGLELCAGCHSSGRDHVRTEWPQ